MRGWNWAAATAASTFLIVVITFAVSVATLPVSGPFCTIDCLQYPYLEAVTRFPRDYYWMYLACLLCLAFVVLLAHIAARAPAARRVPAILALVLGAMASAVLLVDYAVQLSVVQPSLLSGESDGIGLITQYNPHGIFIAIEELGYLLMAFAMACAAAALESGSRSLWIARTSLYAALPLSLLALLVISISYGLHREYRFEVFAISITWLLMLPASAALLFAFRRAGNAVRA